MSQQQNPGGAERPPQVSDTVDHKAFWLSAKVAGTLRSHDVRAAGDSIQIGGE
jgi:hypothetical protein